jgi:hypothetical protein
MQMVRRMCVLYNGNRFDKKGGRNKDVLSNLENKLSDEDNTHNGVWKKLRLCENMRDVNAEWERTTESNKRRKEKVPDLKKRNEGPGPVHYWKNESTYIAFPASTFEAVFSSCGCK